ncbi:SagB/ThcOx family dehydrogenase [Spirulina sp. CS-785/01]|uniref:SagB/ThcOx family dehydrogenase n=1 Tax=Spirulina sp. CS-785/01 TaxID=3021716 RepID=UPI00232EF32E|nr:SagB/ThcOx family dehydrogenase [Spirulina sp. CS-785/01]MDB9314384.1 SagB/ThcOx family dehydrogenase [Spirulina sp. CS-785/01]
MTDFSNTLATYYHERTKYDPDTIASKGRGIDWSKQPVPFKEYKIGQTLDLKPYLSQESKSKTDSETVFWRRLSQLLYCSYGITAKMATMMGPPIYLRAAPSAGGLYPAEVYLLSRGTPLLPAGLYNYQPQTHALVQFWEKDVWATLRQACFFHPALEETNLAIATSTVYYRSAWRYEDRAYRRIFLDTGHLLGNIELAGAVNGFRPCLIGGFQDKLMNQLLYLNEEEEGVMTVIPLLDVGEKSPQLPPNLEQNSQYFTALPSGLAQDYPDIADGELLGALQKATEIESSKPLPSPSPQEAKMGTEDKYNFPFCLKVSMYSSPIDWKEDLADLEQTILKRRSTRAYTGADLTLEELQALLHFTYQPQDYTVQGLDPAPDYFDLSLVETFVAVSGVVGLEEGCYYYAPKDQELRQIRFKNFRRELHYLCLGQDLGRDAGAVIFHTADLKGAIAKYGDRVYRYLHMDAGHLGQRLNLAAIHLGLGVSGIGGFFDDQVNEVLGIPKDEAVIYISTLGRPRQ